MDKLKTLIQTSDELEALVRIARNSGAVALDTEFVWERTYYPKLGLIQIALSDEDCYLIDPLAIDDLSALGKLLSNRSVVKIFHDAPQDLAILRRATGTTPQNIFDTRLAAGFAGFQSTLSLSNLVNELLDIELSKEETRTNWLQRPLTAEQVRYALDDVRYLRAVRVLLLTRIIGPKIKSWLQEELNLLNNPATYNGPPDNERYRRIRGSSSLDRQGLAILKNLTNWREGMARKLDRPRGHVVPDGVLLEAARSKAVSTKILQDKTTLSAKALSKYGDTLAAIADTSCKQSPDAYPREQRPVRLSQPEKNSLDRLHKFIDLKCELLGIAPSLVGNSSELKELIKTLRHHHKAPPQHLRQTEGWRKEIVEDFFRNSAGN